METVRNIRHGIFLQYEVGAHSFECVNFLTFEDQYHLKERPKETRDQYHAALKGHVCLMHLMQVLVQSKYLKLRTNQRAVRTVAQGINYCDRDSWCAVANVQ